MANERTRIYENGREVGHIDTIGDGLYYNVVHNGRTVEQIIPRAGGRWYDREVNGKKIVEVVTDPRTWH
jgi:hypothetical protein